MDSPPQPREEEEEEEQEDWSSLVRASASWEATEERIFFTKFAESVSHLVHIYTVFSENGTVLF